MQRVRGSALICALLMASACGGAKRGGANGGTTGSAGGGETTGAAGTTGRAGTTGGAGTTGVAGMTGSAGTTGGAGTTGAAGPAGAAGTGGASAACAPIVPRDPNAFVHPGGLLKRSDMDRMRYQVAAGIEPWASAYGVLRADALASPTYAVRGNPTWTQVSRDAGV